MPERIASMLSEAAAAWRLAHLLVEEDGPYALFARLRYRAGVRSVASRDGDGNLTVTRVALNAWAEGLTCVWCVSVWTAAALGLARRTRAGRALVSLLATSAGAILMQEAVAWLRSRR
jgi:hypothetical protein